MFLYFYKSIIYWCLFSKYKQCVMCMGSNSAAGGSASDPGFRVTVGGLLWDHGDKYTGITYTHKWSPGHPTPGHRVH